MFWQCLGNVPRRILPRYSVHLLNKDVLNKDNLSLQKVTFDVHKIKSGGQVQPLGKWGLGEAECWWSDSSSDGWRCPALTKPLSLVLKGLESGICRDPAPETPFCL